MEKLVFYSMTDVLSVEFDVTVFGVSQQGMSCTCKVGTDLVGAACDEFDFQKCHFSVAA